MPARWQYQGKVRVAPEQHDGPGVATRRSAWHGDLLRSTAREQTRRYASSIDDGLPECLCRDHARSLPSPCSRPGGPHSPILFGRPGSAEGEDPIWPQDDRPGWLHPSTGNHYWSLGRYSRNDHRVPSRHPAYRPHGWSWNRRCHCRRSRHSKRASETRYAIPTLYEVALPDSPTRRAPKSSTSNWNRVDRGCLTHHRFRNPIVLNPIVLNPIVLNPIVLNPIVLNHWIPTGEAGGLVLPRTHRGLQNSSPWHPGSRDYLRTTGPKSVWALLLLMPLGAEYQREFVRPW